MDKLKKIFARVLSIPESAVTDTLSPENTESWDSLSVIILLSEIEKGFGVTFTFDEVISVTDFDSACKLLASKGIAL